MYLFFTVGEMPGGLAHGARVAKCSSAAGDLHADGACGRVLGAIGAEGVVLGYLVSWDDAPDHPALMAPSRLRPVVLLPEGGGL